MRGEAASIGALRVLADSPLTKHEHRLRYANREEALMTQEAIASMVEPPPQQAWESIRTSFVGLVQQVRACAALGLSLMLWLHLAFAAGTLLELVFLEPFKGFTLWLYVLRMRSKAWLAAPVLLAHAEVTKNTIFFQWVRNLGTPTVPVFRLLWGLRLHARLSLNSLRLLQ